VLEPAPVLAAWCGEVRRVRIARLARRGAGWALEDPDGRIVGEADAVIVAAGPGAAQLAPSLALRPVRGQASWADQAARPPACAWGGYLVPTRTGVLFGATHDRDQTGVEVRAADHARNLATLAARLPQHAAALGGAPLAGRAAVRATTADRLPLAGEAGGLFVLTGFGSRGLSLAPLLAEHLAARALGAPSPLPAPLAALVEPGRFAGRQARQADGGGQAASRPLR
jgi:tRNA 5-methylaminomethyl-2-thiouridine biosynthesis bifunctional protein